MGNNLEFLIQIILINIEFNILIIIELILILTYCIIENNAISILIP